MLFFCKKLFLRSTHKNILIQNKNKNNFFLKNTFKKHSKHLISLRGIPQLMNSQHFMNKRMERND